LPCVIFIILGVLQTIVAIKEREQRGVGRQNLPYSAPLDSFMRSLNEISEDACELFRRYFCGRSKKLKPTHRSLNHNKNSNALLSVSIEPDEETHNIRDMLHLPSLPETHKEIGSSNSNSVTASAADQQDSETDQRNTDVEEISQSNVEIEQRELAFVHHALQHPSEIIPCPGIVCSSFVDSFLQLLGGSRPRHVIAKELFPQAMSQNGKILISALTEPEQALLLDTLHREAMWRIDKPGKCVRSIRCLGTCEQQAKACFNCVSLNRNGTFRAAISRARRKSSHHSKKTLDHLRFVPTQFTKADPFLRKLSQSSTLRELVLRSKEFAQEDLTWLKVARLGISGAFHQYPVMEGVVKSLIEVKDKARRGVGKQNMSYSKELDAFMHQLAAISLSAFDLFSKHFCVRSLRSQKIVKKHKVDTLLHSPNSDTMQMMSMPALFMYESNEDRISLNLHDVNGLISGPSFVQELENLHDETTGEFVNTSVVSL
jgi:hypothetical protein